VLRVAAQKWIEVVKSMPLERDEDIQAVHEALLKGKNLFPSDAAIADTLTLFQRVVGISGGISGIKGLPSGENGANGGGTLDKHQLQDLNDRIEELKKTENWHNLVGWANQQRDKLIAQLSATMTTLYKQASSSNPRYGTEATRTLQESWEAIPGELHSDVEADVMGLSALIKELGACKKMEETLKDVIMHLGDETENRWSWNESYEHIQKSGDIPDDSRIKKVIEIIKRASSIETAIEGYKKKRNLNAQDYSALKLQLEILQKDARTIDFTWLFGPKEGSSVAPSTDWTDSEAPRSDQTSPSDFEIPLSALETSLEKAAGEAIQKQCKDIKPLFNNLLSSLGTVGDLNQNLLALSHWNWVCERHKVPKPASFADTIKYAAEQISSFEQKRLVARTRKVFTSESAQEDLNSLCKDLKDTHKVIQALQEFPDSREHLSSQNLKRQEWYELLRGLTSRASTLTADSLIDAWERDIEGLRKRVERLDRVIKEISSSEEGIDKTLDQQIQWYLSKLHELQKARQDIMDDQGGIPGGLGLLAGIIKDLETNGVCWILEQQRNRLHEEAEYLHLSGWARLRAKIEELLRSSCKESEREEAARRLKDEIIAPSRSLQDEKSTLGLVAREILECGRQLTKQSPQDGQTIWKMVLQLTKDAIATLRHTYDKTPGGGKGQ
jgi:hypothetical protein